MSRVKIRVNRIEVEEIGEVDVESILAHGKRIEVEGCYAGKTVTWSGRAIKTHAGTLAYFPATSPEDFHS